MVQQNNLNLIASDLHNNNSFLSVINALWNNNLDSLMIVKEENKTFYSNLTDCEKEQLLLIMHKMCKEKSDSTWCLRIAALN